MHKVLQRKVAQRSARSGLRFQLTCVEAGNGADMARGWLSAGASLSAPLRKLKGFLVRSIRVWEYRYRPRPGRFLSGEAGCSAPHHSTTSLSGL